MRPPTTTPRVVKPQPRGYELPESHLTIRPLVVYHTFDVAHCRVDARFPSRSIRREGWGWGNRDLVVDIHQVASCIRISYVIFAAFRAD